MDNTFRQYNSPFTVFVLENFLLENGTILESCNITYRQVGELNELKDNLVLITTWYAATSKIVERIFVGNNRALNAQDYCIVIVDQFGNGMSTSPSDFLGKADEHRICFSISDDVRAQHKLLTDIFKIDSIKLLLGGSMGAMQAWEWLVRYPDMIHNALLIAGTSHIMPYSSLIVSSLINSLQPSNCDCFEPLASTNNKARLTAHADLWLVYGYCSKMYQKEEYKQIGFDSLDSFRNDYMRKYFSFLDVRNLICMAQKWQSHDVGRFEKKGIRAALASVKAKVRILAIENDMIFPESDIETDHNLIPNSKLNIVLSNFGHLALFGSEPNFNHQIDENIKEILSQTQDIF